MQLDMYEVKDKVVNAQNIGNYIQKKLTRIPLIAVMGTYLPFTCNPVRATVDQRRDMAESIQRFLQWLGKNNSAEQINDNMHCYRITMDKEVELYNAGQLLSSLEEYFYGIETPVFATVYWKNEETEDKEMEILVAGADIYGNAVDTKRFDLDKMLWYIKVKARMELKCHRII